MVAGVVHKRGLKPVMNRLIVGAAVIVAVISSSALPAAAGKVVSKVDLSSQPMTVIQNGQTKYQWKVSTARKGKVTPTGRWTAKQFKRFHWSSRYGRAPMPYSIFYSGNFAIHGTNQVSKLGRPASAGCIRLSKSNASKLFSMAKRAGLSNTVVIVEH
jgi:lipoprotein-anchoring transpeptidase ErfK/SrfK